MYILLRLPDDNDVDFLNHPPKATDIIISDRHGRVRLFESIIEADDFREDLDIRCLTISWP